MDPPPVASTWPPSLQERYARKFRAVRSLGMPWELAERVPGGLQQAMVLAMMAERDLMDEEARLERLHTAGMLEESGEMKPDGPGTKLCQLPDDLLREILYHFQLNQAARKMPLVCSDWAKRLNHRLLRVGSFYSPGRTPPRPEGADVRELMLDLRAAAAEGRDVLPEVRRALEAAPALAKLDAFLTRDQLLRFAEAVTGDPELRSTRRISSLGLSVFPASSSSGRAAEAEAAEAGEMLSRLPGEGGRFCSFALTCQFGRPHRDQRCCEVFLQKFSGRVFAMQVNENLMSTAFATTFEGVTSLNVQCNGPRLRVPRFAEGRGLAASLAYLCFSPFPLPGGMRGNERPRATATTGQLPPMVAYCDDGGGTTPEQALEALASPKAPLEHLAFNLNGSVVPSVLSIPACFRVLGPKLRGLTFKQPRYSPGLVMPAAEPFVPPTGGRSSRSVSGVGVGSGGVGVGSGGDIVIARTLRQPQFGARRGLGGAGGRVRGRTGRGGGGGQQQLQDRPWEVFSQIEELNVTFFMGTFKLVLPPEGGMPRLRRLLMMAMGPEEVDAEGEDVPIEDPLVLPPPAEVIPNVEFLAYGYEHSELNQVDIAALLFGKATLTKRPPPLNPCTKLRSVLLQGCELEAKGGRDQRVRLASAWTRVFPALRMLHLHFCSETEGARRVLDGLEGAYAAAEAAEALAAGAKVSSSEGGGGGGEGGEDASAAAAAAAAASPARRFWGICRGCPGGFEMS